MDSSIQLEDAYILTTAIMLHQLADFVAFVARKRYFAGVLNTASYLRRHNRMKCLVTNPQIVLFIAGPMRPFLDYVTCFRETWTGPVDAYSRKITSISRHGLVKAPWHPAVHALCSGWLTPCQLAG